MQIQKTALTAQQNKAIATLMSHEGWAILLDIIASRALEAALTASEIRLRSFGGTNPSLAVSAAENESEAAMLRRLSRELSYIASEPEEERYTITITP